jgi:hypothetical protein
MSVNLKAIDTKIRKLQKLRELLADDDTRDLMADPEIMSMVRDALSSNGNGNGNGHSTVPVEPEQETLPAEGSLKRAVLDTARMCPGKFDTAEIVRMMEGKGFRFQAHAPKISVNQALTKLAENGLIRLIRRGSGRQPNIYDTLVRREATIEHK